MHTNNMHLPPNETSAHTDSRGSRLLHLVANEVQESIVCQSAKVAIRVQVLGGVSQVLRPPHTALTSRCACLITANVTCALMCETRVDELCNLLFLRQRRCKSSRCLFDIASDMWWASVRTALRPSGLVGNIFLCHREVGLSEAKMTFPSVLLGSISVDWRRE